MSGLTQRYSLLTSCYDSYGLLRPVGPCAFCIIYQVYFYSYYCRMISKLLRKDTVESPPPHPILSLGILNFEEPRA